MLLDLSKYYHKKYSQLFLINNAADIVNNSKVILVLPSNKIKDLGYLRRFYNRHYQLKVKFNRVIRNGFYTGYQIFSTNYKEK